MPLQIAVFQSLIGPIVADVTTRATGVSWTTNEHGYERLSGAADAGLPESFRMFNQPGNLHVEANWNALALWEGRREDPGLHAGAADGGYDLGAIGYWHALSDLPYVAFWSTTSVAEWRTVTAEDLAANITSERYTIDTNNRLYVAPQKNNAYTITTTQGALVYEVLDSTTRSMVGADITFSVLLPVGWTARLLQYDAVWGFLGVVWTQAGTAALVTGAAHITMAGTGKLVFIVNPATGAYVGETGANYAKITSIRIVSSLTNRVNTTLTVARANGAGVTCTVGSTARMYAGQLLVIAGGGNSERVAITAVTGTTTFTATIVNAPGGGYPIGTTVQAHVIYADEVVSDMLTSIVALNPGQLSSSTALIQSPALDLTDVIYADTACDTVLASLAQLGDATSQTYEVGVYERRALFFRPQGSAGRAWYIDADELDIQRSIEDLANSAYATYQGNGGRTLRTAISADAASIAQYGLTRRASVATTTTSSTQAASLRDTFVADQKDPLPRAKITFDRVYDAHGVRYPLLLVRANDTITIRNLSPALGDGADRVRTFQIMHTETRPAEGIEGVITIEIETPLPTTVTTIAGVGKAAGDSRETKNSRATASKNNKNI
jgi:hypothetical protein